MNGCGFEQFKFTLIYDIHHDIQCCVACNMTINFTHGLPAPSIDNIFISDM